MTMYVGKKTKNSIEKTTAIKVESTFSHKSVFLHQRTRSLIKKITMLGETYEFAQILRTLSTK